MRRSDYLPEGAGPLFAEHQPLSVLQEAMERQTVLEGMAIRCDGRRDLTVRFGGWEGTIPRIDAVHPAISGAERDIALLSRVGKPTCFTITRIAVDGGGRPRLTLSRRAAQEQAIAWLLEHSAPGTILPARVTHLERFGAFVDLTHKELLGTWLENAAAFSPGDAVQGIVRSVRDYGLFIELTPNLSGLADYREDAAPGDRVSVYIKSIRPDTRKIKLQIIQNLGPAGEPAELTYFITDGAVENWTY